MVFIHTNEEDLEFAQDFASGNMPARVLAILAGVILDERLLQAIKAHWYDMEYKKGCSIFQDLFRDGAPLGNFKTRINIGYAIGLYGEDVYSDLCIINKIRNKFAHSRKVKDFDTDSINSQIKNLKTPELYPFAEGIDTFADTVNMLSSLASHLEGEKQRFVTAVEILSLLLLTCQVRPIKPSNLKPQQ